MSTRLIVFLLIGMVLIFLVMMQCRPYYGIPVWKIACLAPISIVAGMFSVKLMSFIESGTWEGMSFFGVVLFVPIMYTAVALLLRMRYAALMDICAPGVSIMCAFMKVHCLIEGCCGGKVLYLNANGAEVRFPSQIVESVNAILIMTILIWMISRKRHAGKIYAWFMIIYGVTRFVLNFFREASSTLGIIPHAHIWSVVSIAVGVLWIVLKNRRQKVS